MSRKQRRQRKQPHKKHQQKPADSHLSHRPPGTAGAASKGQLVGLNIYRAIAIFMMMAAHSIRIQSNYTLLAQERVEATLFDHFLMLFIKIEPIISAMFLFIAGFSLTLSYFKLHNHSQRSQWLSKIAVRAIGLYAVAVVFFLAEYGLQWPDLLVSAGVLGTIGLSILLSAILLVYGKGWRGLLISTVACLLITFLLEAQQWQVTGLNAGAGGHLPLVVMGFIGTLYGLVYHRFGDNGLFAGLALTAALAILTMVVDYPNTFTYRSQFFWYSAAPEQQFIQSLLAIFASDISHSIKVAGFWNHASVFPLRYTAIIVLFMILCIKGINNAKNPLISFFNALGSYGLTIYVFHLIILAILEVTGLKPATGWQTLLLILILMVAGYLVIRNRIQIDPDT